jgi:hypothetical protein
MYQNDVAEYKAAFLLGSSPAEIKCQKEKFIKVFDYWCDR